MSRKEFVTIPSIGFFTLLVVLFASFTFIAVKIVRSSIEPRQKIAFLILLTFTLALLCYVAGVFTSVFPIFFLR